MAAVGVKRRTALTIVLSSKSSTSAAIAPTASSIEPAKRWAPPPP